MKLAPTPKGFTSLASEVPSIDSKPLYYFVLRSDEGLWGTEFGMRLGFWSKTRGGFLWWDDEYQDWIEILDHPEDIAWIYCLNLTEEDVFKAVLTANEQAKD